MKKILLLLLIFSAFKGYAQTSTISHDLAESIKLTRVPDGYKPLVMVDGEPYYGDLKSFKASSIESVRILDSVTSHAVWQGQGVHGAIDIQTKDHRINECKNKLAELGKGFRRFVSTHQGDESITYRLNGHILTGDKFAIARQLYAIPDDHIKWVLTALDTTAYGEGAIVSVRTKK